MSNGGRSTPRWRSGHWLRSQCCRTASGRTRVGGSGAIMRFRRRAPLASRDVPGRLPGPRWLTVSARRRKAAGLVRPGRSWCHLQAIEPPTPGATAPLRRSRRVGGGWNSSSTFGAAPAGGGAGGAASGGIGAGPPPSASWRRPPRACCMGCCPGAWRWNSSHGNRRCSPPGLSAPGNAGGHSKRRSSWSEPGPRRHASGSVSDIDLGEARSPSRANGSTKENEAA